MDGCPVRRRGNQRGDVTARPPRMRPPACLAARDQGGPKIVADHGRLFVGLVHRIESQNAYVGCARPAERHCSHFIICRDCGVAAELPGQRIDEAIEATAADCGFLVESDTVEVTGLCSHCRADGGNARSHA